MTFDVKHRIARGKFRNFQTHDYIDEGVSWVDILFLGPDRFTFFNATLRSAPMAITDEIHNLAFNETWDALSPEEKTAQSSMDFKPLGNGLSEWIRPERVALPQFEGRNFHDQLIKREKEIEVTLHANVSIDISYRYGIGLDAIIDLAMLDVASIEMFVDFFQSDLKAKHYDLSRTAELWRADEPLVNTEGVVWHSNALVLD